MKKNLTLVILAAGMGSRFGGLKQIEPVGPNNEFIIDYSVYDAIKAGFKKIVFVIKKENYEIFKETIGKRIEDKIEVKYVFQQLDDIPSGINIPKQRIKPLGTAHAIYAARKEIDDDFAIINADDFYGFDAFKVLCEFLNQEKDNKHEHFAIVGYKAINTMTDNGSVKRGVCKIKDGYLQNLIESKLEKQQDKIIAYPLNGSNSFYLEKDCLVSMNMIGFSKKIMDYIADDFLEFLTKNNNDLLTCEYLIPDVIFKAIKEEKADVKVLKTDAKWYGVTYKEDKIEVVEAINKLIKDKIYPSKLWK